MCVDEERLWGAVPGLVAEMRRCDKLDLPTAAMAMAFVCIDTLAGLAREAGKTRTERSDFIGWVDQYLVGHPEQPYQYRGIDVYAARCAVLHSYGAEAALHTEDPNIVKFIYHDGGRHIYDPNIDVSIAIIGTRSFVNDVAIGAQSFLEACRGDQELRALVQGRLGGVLQIRPFPSNGE